MVKTSWQSRIPERAGTQRVVEAGDLFSPCRSDQSGYYPAKPWGLVVKIALNEWLKSGDSQSHTDNQK